MGSIKCNKFVAQSEHLLSVFKVLNWESLVCIHSYGTYGGGGGASQGYGQSSGQSYNQQQGYGNYNQSSGSSPSSYNQGNYGSYGQHPSGGGRLSNGLHYTAFHCSFLWLFLFPDFSQEGMALNPLTSLVVGIIIPASPTALEVTAAVANQPTWATASSLLSLVTASSSHLLHPLQGKRWLTSHSATFSLLICATFDHCSSEKNSEAAWDV